jgi:hypothetical protein
MLIYAPSACTFIKGVWQMAGRGRRVMPGCRLPTSLTCPLSGRTFDRAADR